MTLDLPRPGVSPVDLALPLQDYLLDDGEYVSLLVHQYHAD
jgi:hypothetical protein